ncbi:hypothetical protein M918_03410 [Clostridium sp. BL8]|nr:hypothetical protein M918_03410 [Clostridium sp. BL8]
MKDSYTRKSLFSQIKDSISNSDFEKLSNLQIQLDSEMKNLRKLYADYRRNLMSL